MSNHQIYLGYWYQRTSLHLSEIYDFLRNGTSPLNLDKEKLKQLQSELAIKNVNLKIDILEYIELKTQSGFTVKAYEDGLVIITKNSSRIHETKKELAEFYETKFTPAISYLFSLGAPIPKELAKTKTTYPYFLLAQNANRETINALLKELGEEEYFELTNKTIDIFRGDSHFVINNKGKFEGTQALIEMLIFFSEFKAQLHRYLNLHRSIWEKIQQIKEQGSISGRNIGKQRNDLESYKKTIELIDGRIEQMGLYITTRESIVKNNGWEKFLTEILAFKYENLRHNLDYVKALWKMTSQYVDAAIQIFSEINQQSTKNAVNALTIISSIGVVSVILAHLSKTEYPIISPIGIYYFILLLSISFFINRLINFVFKNMKYKVTDVDYKKNID
jgi:hypothetical protein